MDGTYTWFSPLGAKNQAPTDMATTITRPMMGLHLCGQSASE